MTVLCLALAALSSAWPPDHAAQRGEPCGFPAYSQIVAVNIKNAELYYCSFSCVIPAVTGFIYCADTECPPVSTRRYYNVGCGFQPEGGDSALEAYVTTSPGIGIAYHRIGGNCWDPWGPFPDPQFHFPEFYAFEELTYCTQGCGCVLPLKNPVIATAAVVSITYEVSRYTRDDLPFEGAISGQTALGPTDEISQNVILRRVSALRVNDVAQPNLAIWQNSTDTRLEGFVQDEKTPQILADIAMSAPAASTFVISLVQARFTDDVLDVDGNERFNVLDAAALDIIASTDPNNPIYVEKYDFDGSGMIDPPDVEFLQIMVDSHYDSGIFADADGDELLECSDLVGFDALIGKTLSDPEYNIRLDRDLSGTIDASDKYWAFQTILPGDLNMDGVVSLADYALLASCWGTACGDINGDGTTDLADQGIMFGNWGATCP